MRLLALIVLSLLASGCASNTAVQEPVEVVTVQKEFPPQLWSDHKELGISTEACAEKGMQILNSLGFTQVVKSRHGEYLYGNYSNNRAAIKCITVKGQTLVYAIVAGPKKAVVEKLRNEIMWQY